MEDVEEIKEILKNYDQEHLLMYYSKLDDEKKEKLIKQINNIDFKLMNELYENAQKEKHFEDCTIESVEYIEKSKLTNSEKKGYEQKGIEAIKKGKYAVVTMAGGQGTRLGHVGPKGTYDLGLDSHKSIFEVLCEGIKKAMFKYETIIHWYIMTSEENNDDTVNFFVEHNYFGYPKEAIHFFKQSKLPMLDLNGKVLLNEDGTIKEASNGHGGTLQSMEKNNVIKEMKKNGIEWVFISGVDNILANLVDPLLIGVSISNKVLCAVKSVEKIDPKEKVGVLCKKNGKISVIEYTEIPDEMANMRDDYGSLIYGDSNVIMQLFNIKAFDKISNQNLPYHTAVKKANYVDDKGKLIVADKPNAYKFERFIFDSFETLDSVVILRVKREEEFAPIKNAEGVDSPETARKLYNDFFSKINYMKKYSEWCTNPVFDDETRHELLMINGQEEEIRDRFYKDLEFGTAGLRGVIGSGTNRMNKYTVTKATQGLANYILREGTEGKGVAISYDSRRKSKEFAIETALCMNANGIKTYIFNELRPVPELSFAVRELGCTAGIMITASHNPPEYNGYKVYWDDGAQIVAPRDKEIIEEVNNVTDYSLIKTLKYEDAQNSGLYNVIGSAMDKMYLREVKKQVLNKDIIKEMSDDVNIVYTPLHGTGGKLVQTVLDDLGFNNVYIVPEQELPNGNFPTVEYPNPEDSRAFELALKLAQKVNADVVLANDPDADRLGVFSIDRQTGEYKVFTGNMSALLIAEYVLSQRKEKNLMPINPAFVSTIVSSNLAGAIAKEYGMYFTETLTGFKFIGEQIRQYEQSGKYNYVFGFEESYGCLVGTHARDKDGITAVTLLCEAAAYYKKQGFTLWDQMQNIYKKYGYYKEDLITYTLKGADGAIKIKEIMETIRNNPPKKFGKLNIIERRDYKSSISVNTETNIESKIALPVSNVLYYVLEDDAWCAVRPSGTEPKIKFYIGVKGKDEKDAISILNSVKKDILSMVE